MSEREAGLRVTRRLMDAGHEALFAGGCVRDRLRGVEAHDIDVATSARPEEVQALFSKTVAVGAAFGVIVVVEPEGQIEVATFREDLGVADGRHPLSIRYADAEADAKRRDFTINGMFEHPETGAILDFVGGQADLKARLIRCIGEPEERFREDRLRLLRAVRFATVLDFRIEERTYRALRRHAAGIRDVSAERVQLELTKMLVSGRGGRGVGLLKETGLLALLLPEVDALDGVAQPARFHPEGDVFTHTRMLLDEYREGGEAVALAALLHDIGKTPTATVNDKGRIAFPNHAKVGAAMARAVLERLRYPRRTADQVENLVARHMEWPDLPKMRTSKRRRNLLDEDLPLHMELHRLDCEACHGDTSIHDYALEERRKLLAEPPPIRPLLSGHDLKRMGYAPGIAFGVMLESLVDAQLEGLVTGQEQARAWLTGRFAAPDGRPLAGSDLS